MGGLLYSFAELACRDVEMARNTPVCISNNAADNGTENLKITKSSRAKLWFNYFPLIGATYTASLIFESLGT
jgi:hypothetical protein